MEARVVPCVGTRLRHNCNAMGVMMLKDMEVLGDISGCAEKVWKELCYIKAETLGDTEEAAR